MSNMNICRELDWLADWLDAQFDADKTREQLHADPYYQRVVTALHEARIEKWGRCADCKQATQTCITEILATGKPVEVCPEGR